MNKTKPPKIPVDYSRKKVPEDKTVKGIKIASIIVGIGVTLPVFFIGSEVTQAVGLSTASLIFFWCLYRLKCIMRHYGNYRK